MDIETINPTSVNRQAIEYLYFFLSYFLSSISILETQDLQQLKKFYTQPIVSSYIAIILKELAHSFIEHKRQY